MPIHGIFHMVFPFNRFSNIPCLTGDDLPTRTSGLAKLFQQCIPSNLLVHFSGLFDISIAEAHPGPHRGVLCVAYDHVGLQSRLFATIQEARASFQSFAFLGLGHG